VWVATAAHYLEITLCDDLARILGESAAGIVCAPRFGMRTGISPGLGPFNVDKRFLTAIMRAEVCLLSSLAERLDERVGGEVEKGGVFVSEPENASSTLHSLLKQLPGSGLHCTVDRIVKRIKRIYMLDAPHQEVKSIKSTEENKKTSQ
jgi:hypothetical protein